MNWLSISPTSGHGNTQITLSASTLTGLQDRIATLIATGSQEGQTLSATTVITQKYLTLTEIYFENLTWVTDIPYTGGTATSASCSFTIIAKYSDNSTEDITNLANVTGSLFVPVTTATTRQSVGTLTLTATYEDKTCYGNIMVYQEAPLLSEIFFNNLEWSTDVAWSGGTATKNNCNYSVYAKYSNNVQVNITNEAEVTGSLAVPMTTATTRQSVGTLTLTATYEDKTCTGNVMVYQEEFSFSKEPLTFNITSDGTIMWIAKDIQAQAMIEYKLNNWGWHGIYSTTAGSVINVKAGDKVQFRGDNATYTSGLYSSTFSGSTAGFSVEGNIMSLTNSTKFENVIEFQDYESFRNLFIYCTGLTSAENLILPATTLSGGCYDHMFYGCTSLTQAPKLSATTIASECYSHMFYGCTSLTTAPELPATTLESNCYSHMFYGCKKLNYIKCLARRNMSAYNCTLKWVSGVADTGTFVKNQNTISTSWERGISGIPEGWTVVNNS